MHIDELEKWFRFLIEKIFVGLPVEDFKSQWYSDPHKDINGIFVAVDKEENILSSVRVFLREIYLSGSIISAGGVGSVGTKEEYRGKGLSTTLFKKCINYMKKKNISISYLLCGDDNERYYNRYDYKKSPFVKKISVIERNVPYPVEYSIRDVDFSLDINALSEMYQIFSGTFNGAVVRSMEYWKSWVSSFPYNKYKIAVDAAGKPVAYMNLDLDGNRFYVFDFGYMPNYSDIFDSFISRIRNNVNENNIDAQYQTAINSNLQVKDYVENCLIMYKLINPFEVKGNRISNTDELLKELKGNSSISKILLWEVDDI